MRKIRQLTQGLSISVVHKIYLPFVQEVFSKFHSKFTVIKTTWTYNIGKDFFAKITRKNEKYVWTYYYLILKVQKYYFRDNILNCLKEQAMALPDKVVFISQND